MNITRICTLYFSATGNTAHVVNLLAETMAKQMNIPLANFPFTGASDREKDYSFTENDVAIIGAPTYAGKLPNKILPDFRDKLHGNGAFGIAVVTFGNRAYDHSLAELCSVMAENGFRTVAAGAFVGQHAFTDKFAAGRPNWSDQAEIKDFAKRIVEKFNCLTEPVTPITVPGDAAAPYYVPKGTDGLPAKFLKAKPKTDPAKCSSCGACAQLCPMGAIDPHDVFSVPGTCIKCQRCVRRCTRHAKYFDDPAFLSHVAMVEQNYAEPKENETFL